MSTTVDRLIATCAAGVVGGGDLDELAHGLCEAMGCDALSVGQGFGFSPMSVQLSVPHAWRDTHRAMADQDPSAAALAGAPSGTLFCAARIAPADRTALSDAFDRFGWRDAGIARFATPGGNSVWMAMYRGDGRRRFDARDDARFAVISPHLGRVLASRSALAAVRADPAETRAAGLTRALAHARLVETRGRVEVVWRPAHRARALAALGIMRPIDAHRLDRALAALPVASAATGRDHLTLSREIVVQLVRDGRDALAILWPRVPSRPALPPLVALRLSPRQREVIEGVLAGATHDELAARLGLSVETVRSHVKAGFRLLGVRSRAQLIEVAAR